MTETSFCTWDDVTPYGDDKADRRSWPGAVAT